MIATRCGAALIASAVLASCYGSSGGTVKDGQSHWLDRCGSRTDCDDGEVCACGVCTIACTEPSTCGAEGLCASVEDSRCAEASKAPLQVCLRDCSDDEDCGASGIECRTGACVAVGLLEVTTLIDLEVLELGETVGVLRFVLTDNAVIWQTASTVLEGAYIFQMDLSSREVTTLAAFPAATGAETQLEVQGDALVYAVGSDVHTVHLEGHMEVWSLEPGAQGRTLWRTDAEHIYYVLANQPDTIFRMAIDQTPAKSFYVSEDGAVIRALALDADSVYLEEEPTASGPETRMRRAPKDGSAAVTLVEPLRTQIGFFTIPMAFFVHDGFLIFDQDMNMAIQATSVEGGEPFTLMRGSDEVATAAYASGGYVYYAESTIPADPVGEHFISRVSIANRESERLHSTMVFTNQVAEADGYLYWVEQGRLLRKAL